MLVTLAAQYVVDLLFKVDGRLKEGASVPAHTRPNQKAVPLDQRTASEQCRWQLVVDHHTRPEEAGMCANLAPYLTHGAYGLWS